MLATYKEEGKRFWTEVVDECIVFLLHKVVHELEENMRAGHLRHLITATANHSSERFVENKRND